MSKHLKLTIRTPESQVYSGNIKFAKLLTEQGVIKVFTNHASLTGAISFSPLVFEDEKQNEENYVIQRGIIMISNKNNTIDIMALRCDQKSELCPTSAKDYLKFIENELKKGTDLSEFKIKFYEEEKYVIEKQIGYLEKTTK